MRIYDRRRQIERLEARRNAVLSGVYANSNYDPQKDGEPPPRRGIVEAIEEDFREDVRRVMEGTSRTAEERELQRRIDEDPFFKPARGTRMTPEEREEIERREGWKKG